MKQNTWKALFKNKAFAAGFLIIPVISLLAVFAPLILRYPYDQIDIPRGMQNRTPLPVQAARVPQIRPASHTGFRHPLGCLLHDETKVRERHL